MPGILSISLEPVQLAKLRELLEPKQYDTAIFKAVDGTTKFVAKAFRTGVKKQLFISDDRLDQVLKAVPPKGDPPVGKINVSQKRIPLSSYKVTASKGGGVTIAIGPGRVLTLSHAFLASVGIGGHEGVFLRARHLPTKGPNVGKGKLTAQGFAGRFAIKEQFSPSVLDVISKTALLASVQVDAQADLVKRLNSQIDRFLGRAKVDRTDDSSL